MQRRTFLTGSLAAAALRGAPKFDLAAIERPRVLKAAEPVSLRGAGHRHRGQFSPRSAGGKHDFFSEGDYWWPDPANPDGPTSSATA